MPPATRWLALPTDALGLVVNSAYLHPRDVGAMRCTCRQWRAQVDATLAHLAPAAACNLEQIGDLCARFPLLTALDMSACDFR